MFCDRHWFYFEVKKKKNLRIKFENEFKIEFNYHFIFYPFVVLDVSRKHNHFREPHISRRFYFYFDTFC